MSATSSATLSPPSPADPPLDAQPGAWASIVGAIRDVAASRELLRQLVLRDLRVRYKQAVLGFGWAVVMPMLIVLAGMLVRFAMARSSGEAMSAAVIGGIAVKALPWAFFAGAMSAATQSLLANKSLLTKIYFPREVLPLATIITQCVDTALGSLVVAVLLAVLGLEPTLQLAWVPLLVVLLVLFTTAVGLFVACANLFFRDVKYIVQVTLTFGIFATPVFFEPAMFGPTGAHVLLLNPVSPFIEGLRLAVVEGHNLALPLIVSLDGEPPVTAWSPWYLVYSAAWALIGSLLSLRLFRGLTDHFAEYA